SRLRPEIPAVLDDLVHALLAIRPEDRPASAAEVYATLAPLSRDLPPIPGLLDGATAAAVQKYAAIVGRVPPPAHGDAAVATEQSPLDVQQIEKIAEQLHAAGEFRAAARQWRRLADHHASRNGDDDPLVFALRLRAARAHVQLGERDRALRQLTALLQDRVRVDGPEHPAVRNLRQEIDHLSGERSGSRRLPRPAPGVDR
ncbi:serine/threonine protein kinase, partial [Micromonospora echinofusca]|nr:serine/threonine protein kinase [Micromonospora echinofusca]